ncbi:nucleoside deaminase [Candidatus Marinimicrobia bacterium MT.SAG.2]|nr:nucleoside deaminase [Candidatus Marinimicrobia bacterium MT.SAG.2]
MNIIEKHQKWMTYAIREAELAFDGGEVPVGAVIVKDNTIIARGHNRRESLNDPTAHAEILAITSAANHLEDWRLKGCTLYVTLEPCPMCAGASVNSKLKQIVFGARDADAGACGTVHDIAGKKNPIHKISVLQGILEHDSKLLLTKFFNTIRKEKKPDSS